MSGLAASPSTETVCEEANRIVYGDREQTYDHPSRNFVRTAHLWNGFIAAKYPGANLTLDEHDVAYFMVMLKVAREIHQHKRDNLVDAIGYIACDAKMHDAEPIRTPPKVNWPRPDVADNSYLITPNNKAFLRNTAEDGR